MNDEVVFTMTDIGDGILKTLKRKLMKQIQDGLFKDSVDVLVNAFENNMNPGLKTLIEIKVFQRFIKYHQKNISKI